MKFNFVGMTHKQVLEFVATQLERWAHASVEGGWSTHQVEPQRDLAAAIDRHLGRTTREHIA